MVLGMALSPSSNAQVTGREYCVRRQKVIAPLSPFCKEVDPVTHCFGEADLALLQLPFP